jgi:hypothetical protein
MRAVGATVVLALALAILTLAPGGASDKVIGGVGPQLPVAWQTSTLLRSAKGSLWWVDTHCRIGRVLLAERRIVRGPGNHCGLYPSPDGRTVLATQTDPDPPSPPGRVVVLDASLNVRATTPIRADAVYPPMTWSPGGAFATICTLGSHGRETVLVDEGGITRLSLGGVCRPAYLTTDALATTDGQNVFIGETTLQIQPELAASIHSPAGGYSVEALAGQRDTLLISVARLEGSLVGAPGAVLVFDRRSGATTPVAVRRGGYAKELGIAPDGGTFWYRGGGTDDATLVSNGGVVPRSVPRVARSYSWSPDGKLLAAAVDTGIEIYDLSSGGHVTIGGLDASRLSWTL